MPPLRPLHGVLAAPQQAGTRIKIAPQIAIHARIKSPMCENYPIAAMRRESRVSRVQEVTSPKIMIILCENRVRDFAAKSRAMAPTPRQLMKKLQHHERYRGYARAYRHGSQDRSRHHLAPQTEFSELITKARAGCRVTDRVTWLEFAYWQPSWSPGEGCFLDCLMCGMTNEKAPAYLRFGGGRKYGRILILEYSNAGSNMKADSKTSIRPV